MLLPHQVRHFLRLLFLLQLIVVLLPWLVSSFCQPYFFFQFWLFLLLLLLLYRVQSLNQGWDFPLLVWCQNSRDFLTLGPPDLFLSALPYLLGCLEGQFGFQFFRHHERIESFWSSVNGFVFWVRVLLNLNSLLNPQLVLGLHNTFSRLKNKITSRMSESGCNIFPELSCTKPCRKRYQTWGFYLRKSLWNCPHLLPLIFFLSVLWCPKLFWFGLQCNLQLPSMNWTFPWWKLCFSLPLTVTQSTLSFSLFRKTC